LVVRLAEHAYGAHPEFCVRLAARHLYEHGHGLVAAVAAQENDRRLFDALRAWRVRPQHLADARRTVSLVVLAEGLEGEYLQVGVVAARLVRVNRPTELRQDLVAQPLRV